MDSSHYGNAMTEIALALAMAFFSLMVLTMVSMGAGGTVDKADTRDPVNPHIMAAVAPAPSNTPNQAIELPGRDDQLLIFKDGQFFDAKLNSLNPATIDPDRRVILAIDPDLPLVQVLAARAKLPTVNLVVSTLTADWQAALKRLDAE